MNTSAEQPWSRASEHMDAMAINSDLEDLGNLFEFGDLDLSNIPSVDSTQYAGHMQQTTGTHPNTPFDEINEAQALGGNSAQNFGAHAQFDMPHNVEQGHKQRQYHGRPHTFTSEPIYQPALQTYHANPQYQFQDMPGFPPSQHVPPTPNSFGMHGETAPFMQQQQQQMDPQQRTILEQRYQLRKQDAIAFTPMVSPVGTPQYNVQPEYTIPGAYFSPLTSPMLHAQNGQSNQQHNQGYYTNPSTAPSSSATSPLDPSIDVDMLGDEITLGDPANSQAKRSSRKKAPAPTPRSAGPLARVKQSPIQKATKRKSGSMLSSLPATLEMETAATTQRTGSAQTCSGSLQPQRNESSENGSISPEPLSEAPMGPPPRPGSSVTQSPAVAGQQKDTPMGQLGKAATPKSILSMRGAQQPGSGQASQKDQNGANDEMDLEELELPAAATGTTATRPSLPPLQTQSEEPSDDTPRLSARKTPKLGPGSTPSARSSSAVVSPSLAGSPMTATTPGTLLKDRKASDAKAGRSNKKRGSVSGNGSALVSPALRPRISPSIKPLLPEGASLHSPTHALLLASKSNYQNLLEGNHLPGVSYPDSLSTGLTSKRTSHKVAEQGRRNRINEALKEMQSLLPRNATTKGIKDNSDGSPEADGEGKCSKEDAQVKSNSSKAATVESANDYIRKLQKKLMEQESALKEGDAIRKENEQLKRKLERKSAATASATQSPAA